MDLEIAKLYKEYADISEKLTPLRNEHNYISVDILKKRDEQEAATSILVSIKKESEQARKDIDEYVKSEKNRIDSYVADSIKSIDKRLLDKQLEISQLEDSSSKAISDQNKAEKLLLQATLELQKIELKKQASMKTLKEYETVYNDKIEELAERESKIVSKENNIETLAKEIKSEKNIAEKGIAKYTKLKEDVEAKETATQNMYLDQIKREQEIMKRELEIEKKLATVADKEKNSVDALEK